MENVPMTDKRFKKLVVCFGYPFYRLTEADCGDRPQLVYRHRYIERPSRLVQFTARFGLEIGDKPMLDAVENAYTFITGNYVPGDQVIMVVNPIPDDDLERRVKAIEILARHLYDGTHPRGHIFKVQSENGEGIPAGRIPTYALAVGDPDPTQNLCVWGDELKSRFPPGIKHIIYWTYHGNFRSCSTSFDLDNSVLSRETRVCTREYNEGLVRDVTNHAIYYEQESIPRWDTHQPVWTHTLDQASHRAQAMITSEGKPVGMYYHELQKYQGPPWLGTNGSMLVWKAYSHPPSRE